MQFAVTVSPDGTHIIQASKDAPRYAQCVYCGMPVELVTQHYLGLYMSGTDYYYQHTSDLSATECKKLHDREQKELERVLNVR